jgi:acyl-CoA synthetase (NDP forming)
VKGLGELFDAAETLGHGLLPRNERLAILTNGGGVGVVATDLLLDEGGELAALQPSTIDKLDKAMPRIWSRANPVDIVGDADGARYAAALDILADDRNVGAVLAMNVPTALTSAGRSGAGDRRGRRPQDRAGDRSWIGGPDADAGRKVLHDAGIPAYDTPLRAVRGFMHTVAYRRRPARAAAHAAVGARGTVGRRAGARRGEGRFGRPAQPAQRTRIQARAGGPTASRLCRRRSCSMPRKPRTPRPGSAFRSR